jgi:hypothetical protein
MLAFLLFRRGFKELRCFMQQLNITLWMNEAKDWSIQINGQRYEHVPVEVMESLVECALIVAQRSLYEAAKRRPV